MIPMDMRHLRLESRGLKGSGPGQEDQEGLTSPSTGIKDLAPYLRTSLAMCSGHEKVINLRLNPRPERIFIIIWSLTSKTPIPAQRCVLQEKGAPASGAEDPVTFISSL